MGSNMTTRLACWFGICSLVLLAAAGARGSSPTATEPQAQRFDTPEQAVQAMASLIGSARSGGGRAGVRCRTAWTIFASGDPRCGRRGLPAGQGDDRDPGRSSVTSTRRPRSPLFGEDEWPWPIPLVNDGKGWRFDMTTGREELLNRRIGRNELHTLAALHEVVDAQREYMSEARDGQTPSLRPEIPEFRGTQATGCTGRPSTARN